MIELIVLLTVFTYGTNFVLYLILKNKKSMPIVEKASIILGINMSVLLLDGILLSLVNSSCYQNGNY